MQPAEDHEDIELEIVCPHCRLFVPESRAEDAPLSRDSAG